MLLMSSGSILLSLAIANPSGQDQLWLQFCNIQPMAAMGGGLFLVPPFIHPALVDRAPDPASPRKSAPRTPSPNEKPDRQPEDGKYLRPIERVGIGAQLTHERGGADPAQHRNHYLGSDD